MANYFKYLPKVKVRVSSIRRNNVEPWIVAKNIFRKCKIIDAVQSAILGFEQVTIQNNERPDQVARRFYGSTDYDWVVLLCNNIVNIYDEWPLSEDQLFNVITKRYGDPDGVHHYETNEIRSNDIHQDEEVISNRGEVVVPAGLQVNENWSYTVQGVTVTNPSIPITNYEYEKQLNDYKGSIWLLKPAYVETFTEEFKRLCEYEPHDEVDAGDVKMTWGSVEEIFVTEKSGYSTVYGNTATVDFASNSELVNRTVTVTTMSSGEQVRTVDTSNVGTVNSSGVISGTTDSSSTYSE